MKLVRHLFPETIEECLSLLARHEGRGRVLAGGTDLFLWMKEEKVSADVFVDVAAIESLRGIDVSDDRVIIGPAATHAEVAAHGEIKRLFPALADGCRSVGSPQIRNVATLGGNIVSAQPAADSAVPLVALGARCEIAGPSGRRVEVLEDLYEGVGKSRVDPTKELITKIIVDRPEGPSGNAYGRISPREAMSLPVVNAASVIVTDGEVIVEARIVTAPVAVTPFRAREAEAYLRGKRPNNRGDLARAAQIAEEEARPRDSLLRGSGEYRKVLVRDLVETTLFRAAERLG